MRGGPRSVSRRYDRLAVCQGKERSKIMSTARESRLRDARRISLAIMLGLSAAVYVSIMVKIIEFGP